MTSQSESLHMESLITLDPETYESLQQELAMLRHDNEQLRRELAECNRSHQAIIHQLSEELEAKFAERIGELLEKVAELQAILDNSPALIYVKDMQGRFLLVNHQLETLFHLTKEQIQEKSNHEVFPKELADTFRQNDQQVLEAGTAMWFEEIALQDDGLHTYLSIKFPLFNAEGIAYAVCGISTDISDRKQADEARFRLAAIVESSDDAIISKTLDGIIVSWNSGAERIFGYTAEEMIGQPVILLVPDDRLDEEPQILKRLRQGERIEHFETIRKRKDGTLINLSLTISPVKDANGNIIGASKIARDISDRKQAERQLQESQELLQLVLNTIPHKVFWKDCNLIYQGSNRAFAEVAGVSSPVEIVGKLDYDLPWTTAESDWFRECDRRVIESDTPELGIIETQLQADGTEAWVETSKLPLHDANGTVIGILGIYQDITERKQAEAQLNQRTEELENTLQELQRTQMQMIQSEKMSGLGQLVAGVAHEINNPVNFIHGNLNHADVYIQDLLGLLQLYQQHYPISHPDIQQKAEHIDLEFLTEDLPKLLTSMKVGADRIQKIVASLRNFSRMDEAEMKEVNIHDGIDSTLMILQHRLKAKPDFLGIEVIKAYGELPLVECYAGQLNQVFMNILSNAIDALEESLITGHCPLPKDQMANVKGQITDPTIRIRTEVADAKYVRIVFSDNGLGMTETVRKRLFDPFFTTKPVGKGTGMGMSISYQIITEKHQGSLQCISSPGQKTEFVIEIPVQQHTRER
jgi:two-component system NtrC family sensor kinase